MREILGRGSLEASASASENEGDHTHTLRTHAPGFSLMRECLRIQSGVTPRGPIASFLGVSPLHPDARSWYRGAIGEIAVAAVLEDLGPEWEVLHSVPVGSGATDIDHVAIGPPGVFTLNVKDDSGDRVWLAGMTMHANGAKQHHVRNALHESARASKLLGAAAGELVDVRPVIVVVNPRAVIRSDDTRVDITTASQLARWLNRQPPVLSDEQLEYLCTLAEQHETWGLAPVELDDADVEQFDRLRVEVSAAHSRRRRLLAAGILAAAIAAVALALQLLAAI